MYFFLKTAYSLLIVLVYQSCKVYNPWAGALVLWRSLIGVYRSTENFSLIWRRHHYGYRTAKFDLNSTLLAIEQWELFCVSHLLWNGASVYNGHLRGSVTLTPIVEQWSCHYLFLRLRTVAAGIRTPNFPLARRKL